MMTQRSSLLFRHVSPRRKHFREVDSFADVVVVALQVL